MLKSSFNTRGLKIWLRMVIGCFWAWKIMWLIFCVEDKRELGAFQLVTVTVPGTYRCDWLIVWSTLQVNVIRAVTNALSTRGPDIMWCFFSFSHRWWSLVARKWVRSFVSAKVLFERGYHLELCSSCTKVIKV